MLILVLASVCTMGLAQNGLLMNGPLGSRPLGSGLAMQGQGQVFGGNGLPTMGGQPIGSGINMQGQGQLSGAPLNPFSSSNSQQNGQGLSINGQAQVGTGPIIAVQPTQSPLVVTGELGLQPVPVLNQMENTQTSDDLIDVRQGPRQGNMGGNDRRREEESTPNQGSSIVPSFRQNPLTCGFGCSRQSTLLMNLDNQFASAACTDAKADPSQRCSSCCHAIALANGIEKTWASGFPSANGRDCVCCINNQTCQ